MGSQTALLIGGGRIPERTIWTRSFRTAREEIEAGDDIIVTQRGFDLRKLEEFMQRPSQ